MYTELNILSPALLFLTLNQKASLTKKVECFPEIRKTPINFFSFGSQVFLKIFKLKKFPTIVLHLTKPCREEIIYYDSHYKISEDNIVHSL